MRTHGIVAAGLAAGWCTVAAVAAAPKAPAKKVAGTAAPQATQPQGAAPAIPRDPTISAEAEEFFETKIRPVLAEKCYSCHGAKLQQAGLRLDTLAGALRGTDQNVPAVVPGDPEKSSLIHVVRFDGKIKMPPQGKLAAAEIEALTQWVKMGAPWPGKGGKFDSSAQKKGPDPAKHWAFQPLVKPALPTVKRKGWVKSPIDAFVLAKLEKKGWTPNPSADRYTLIRRAYFDLIGLPPSAADVQAFVNDKSPTAFSTVVDRLLASPQYGERWGRYWLDVARYADTKGYVFQEERRYPFSYTYRDYVIRAFNEDKPYDRFLQEQIAADHLVQGDDKEALAAMGFLTLGRRFLNNIHDIIDDRMDVVFRGTQGLTVGCARCHDHKYDPIPIKDYYSLYGVFRSSEEPKDLPLIAQPERNAAYLEYERKLNALEGEVQQFLQKKHGELMATARGKIAESLLAAREARPGADFGAIAAKYGLPDELVRRWQRFLAETGKDHHPILAPWFAFAAVPENEFAAKAPALATRFAANADSQKPLNTHVARAFMGAPPASLKDVADRLAQVLTSATDDEQIKHALDSIGGPLNIPVGEVERFFNRADNNQVRALRQKVDQFKATSPAAPPRAMVLVDTKQPFQPRVFVRGNPNNPGDQVPRQFLTVLAGSQPQPFKQGSGRLELAQAITSPSNPLTPRVMANRVWLWHFGSGLVRTPSDFGLRSEPPTNPELLDYLAARFREDGWSIKKLHRLIMLSSTYQMSSSDNPTYGKVDPENTFLWRMNRRRLDFEALRDSMLAASGKLDLTLGGPSVDITQQPSPPRRTVYSFIDRQNLPGVFRVFDVASPDTHSPQRYQTTVPQQALFLLNSPFLIDQATALVKRPEISGAANPEERLRQIYRIVYSRDPAPDELALGLKFLNAAEGMAAERQPVWQFGFGAVDPAANRLKSFSPLPHFTGSAYQGGPSLPDAKTGWVMLNAQGGHAGNDLNHAAVRRWTVPQDGVYQVSGTVVHARPEGDGVQARIISSRTGQLGQWTVFNTKAEAAVSRVQLKKGETLDFIIDCRTNSNHDSFTWVPVIRLVQPAAAGATVEWAGNKGFGAAPRSLGAWEKVAQALLLSNEFAFVD